MSTTMTATQDHAILEADQMSKIAEELEEAWARVFKIVNHFLSQHDKFGFKLIEEKINPSLEDMLLGLKVMGSILNFLDDLNSFEHSEQRMLLNAKQQIILFEQAALAVKVGAEEEYCKIVDMLRNQAQF